MTTIVQYVIVRRDMNWPLGALMAQACHASVAATHLWYNEENTKMYLNDLDNMHKVVLGAKSEDHLKKLADKLAKNNINHKVRTHCN
jgi:peptidyl-tRNA hydrolase